MVYGTEWVSTRMQLRVSRQNGLEKRWLYADYAREQARLDRKVMMTSESAQEMSIRETRAERRSDPGTSGCECSEVVQHLCIGILKPAKGSQTTWQCRGGSTGDVGRGRYGYNQEKLVA